MLHGVSAPVGTHRHRWFSHHPTRGTGVDPHDLRQREVELPSEASSFFEFSLTLRSKAELHADDRVD